MGNCLSSANRHSRRDSIRLDEVAPQVQRRGSSPEVPQLPVQDLPVRPPTTHQGNELRSRLPSVEIHPPQGSHPGSSPTGNIAAPEPVLDKGWLSKAPVRKGTGPRPLQADRVAVNQSRPQASQASGSTKQSPAAVSEKGSLRFSATPASRSSKTAPIRPLEYRDVGDAVARLRASVEAWIDDEAHFASAPRERQARLDETRFMLDALQHNSSRLHKHLAYTIGDLPVGLMALGQPKEATRYYPAHVEIEALVTHPATEGAGGALVEQAVAESQRSGAHGVVRLTSRKDAIPAYQALGFRVTDPLLPDTLLLDPRSRPDLWREQNGQWRLARHTDKKYLTGLGD